MKVKNLNQYSSYLSKYTELRFQENRTMSIAILKGNLVQNLKNSTKGVSARVYSNGSWGFASSPDTDNIKYVIESATQNAVFLDNREKKSASPFTPDNPNMEKDYSTLKRKFVQSEVMDFLREIDSYIERKFPDLSSRTVVLNNLDMEKSLLTSDGASLYSLTPRSYIRFSLSMDKGNDPVEVYESAGGLGQFEDNFSTPDKLFETLDKLYEHLVKKNEGIYAAAGVKVCALDSALAGILAHEAIGHTAEADLVLSGSVAGNYLNKESASPLVTLVDFAHTYDGNDCPVPVYIDDEGTKAEDMVIIDNGILKGYMHNKKSAQHFAVKPTGNARAYEYFDEPLIRMRNTAILPGQSKLSDIISSIDDGYYLIKPSNGQADTTSEFMFGVVLGYEIKDGKLGKALKDLTISGVAFDVLKSVTMISDDMTWSNAGMCGKKQLIPVGLGGPAIKCEINIGGR